MDQSDPGRYLKKRGFTVFYNKVVNIFKLLKYTIELAVILNISQACLYKRVLIIKNKMSKV